MLSTTGAELAAALGGLVSATDRAALSGDYAEHLAAELNDDEGHLSIVIGSYGEILDDLLASGE